MFHFRRSTVDEMPLFQTWNDAPSVHRWVPIDDWQAYFQAVSKQGNYFLYSVYQQEYLVAFVAAEIEAGEVALCLIVAPDLQGKGIGTAVLQQIIAQNRRLFGDVSSLLAGIYPKNIASIRCFEKAGFQNTSVGSDGENMYTRTVYSS